MICEVHMARSTGTVIQNILHWRYLYIVNGVLILLVVFTFGREMIRSHDIDQQILSLKKQSIALQTQNTAISELHDAVQTESFIEREARLKLGLKKPGETFVIVKDGKSNVHDSAVTGKGSPDSLADVSPGLGTKKALANSTKWWYYFFNKQAYHDSLSYDE